MKFYDTSALLDLPPDTLLAQQFLIADITLYELEDIKTSGKKDETTKAKARAVTRLLAEHPAAYTVVSIDYPQLLSILNDVPIKDNNDGTIMATARWYLNELQNKLDNLPKELDADSANEAAELTTLIDSFCFVTSDLSCFNLAQRVMKLPCELSLDRGEAHNDYTGWTEVTMDQGGEVALERAITDGWVEIQPLGFIRGRSFNRSIIYCSEAENLTKRHIQLLIGRVGDGSTLWINGDLRQIDDVAFERNNGIQKLIDKLTGNERFGTVYLPITERSETARLADMLD